jgi:hypothetical protein
MSDHRVLQEISLLLRSLLFDGLQGDDFTSVNSISLESPATLKANPPGNGQPPLLSLYLYEVTPNAHLNNRPLIHVGVGRQEYPPLSLDLHYLLTPLSDTQTDNLVILGRAMQILAAYPIIRANFLDSLLRPAKPEVRVTINPVSLEELTRIWNAFNQPYGLSVCYLVQPVSIDSARLPEEGPPVEQSIVDVHQIMGAG